MEVIRPASGYLACGDTGAGKMPEPETLFEYILRTVGYPKDMVGKKVLITAGPTREAIDPVRYIGNRSSGKMGYAIAEAAAARGAEVTLISGPVALSVPGGVKRIGVESAAQMREAVLKVFPDTDIVIKAAAVADYRPEKAEVQKIKKSANSLTLVLTKNPDILAELGQLKQSQFLVGFAAETQELVAHATEKLRKKNLDMLVANDVTLSGAGFEADTNIVKILTPDGAIEELPQMSKQDLGRVILDRIIVRRSSMAK